MFQWLVLAALVAVAAAEPDAVPAPAANPVSITEERYEDRRSRYDDRDDLGYEDDLNDDHNDDDHNGPNVVRVLDPSKIAYGPNLSRQNKIILEAYSPDYYQPTWILDYRYQKTGGRDYTRADGGQILVLPRNVHSNEKKQFGNYDDLLEFLRLQRLAESEAHLLHDRPKNRGERFERRGHRGQGRRENLNQWQRDEGLSGWKRT